MNSEDIINRIKSIPRIQDIIRPEKVFYSGPNLTEEAIYYGDKIRYKDSVDFWISILSWIHMDSIEFDDITIYNEKGQYPDDINFCKKLNSVSEEIKKVVLKIQSLNQYTENTEIINSYRMSNEWCDKKILFDCGDKFFLYNWYTGE
ncbi:hypothetical protein M666_18650 [Cellulophaga baltica 18]|uniref:Uncharacterized protein n=2 Tax=Cellulophaga baltica TaxID=76594 RepID=A0AAU8RM44_9FLAO|nr:hypothetical protein M666_18650 [Cellulophaga baltica 18]